MEKQCANKISKIEKELVKAINTITSLQKKLTVTEKDLEISQLKLN